MKRRIFTYLLLLGLTVSSVRADSVEKALADNSPETELASFEIAEGYSVNLFASEKLGIANPIAMNWDHRNRLWVLCSLVYPQLIPTEQADDKLYILEDTDNDGMADRSSVFVEGLNLPTGFALGDGGVYIGEGSELVFYSDTDHDDIADQRSVIFSGFGTGDTHQNINSFTWSPDGELHFCQGLHAFSRIETPWGIARLDEHGVWKMRPRKLQLFPFRGVAGQNPWGLAFGHWGEGFVKGNGTTLCEYTPHALPTSPYRPKDLVIGATKIKSMVPLIVDSPHFPETIQNHVLIAGYYAHIIDRMALATDGAGHQTRNFPPLVRTDHQSFRPVDLKTGPDGAIYIADWYNPIIGHYQASLRHPDRDKKHGRIWRVTAKGRPPLEQPKLHDLTVAQLIERLASPVRYERDRVKEFLSSKPSDRVVKTLDRWVSQPGRTDHEVYEAACVYAWHESVNPPVLNRLLSSKVPLARAFGARLVSRWHDRIDSPKSLLSNCVHDSHPRVRLEAVIACGYLPFPDSITLALEALDHPLDRYIESALVQVSHAQRDRWFPAFERSEIHFKKPDHLAFALNQSSGPGAYQMARDLLGDGTPDTKDLRLALLLLLSNSPKPNDQLYVFSQSLDSPAILNSLANAVAIHDQRPSQLPLSDLAELLDQSEIEKQKAAVRLAGLWRATSLADSITGLLDSPDSSLQMASIESLGRLVGEECFAQIGNIARTTRVPKVLETSLGVLADIDLAKAAEISVSRLNGNDINMIRAAIIPFTGRNTGLSSLAHLIAKKHGLPDETSAAVRSILGGAGIHSMELDKALGQPMNNKIGIPAYSETLIDELAARDGNIENGKKIFSRAELSCVACHQIGEQSTPVSLGPELSAVGAGLPKELIIEAVLWPARQVKEGFLSTSISTRQGKVISGYLQVEDRQQLTIRNAATMSTETVLKKDIKNRTDAGTLMPKGLTSGLTKSELIDLVSYLASLKGQ